MPIFRSSLALSTLAVYYLLQLAVQLRGVVENPAPHQQPDEPAAQECEVLPSLLADLQQHPYLQLGRQVPLG